MEVVVVPVSGVSESGSMEEQAGWARCEMGWAAKRRNCPIGLGTTWDNDDDDDVVVDLFGVMDVVVVAVNEGPLDMCGLSGSMGGVTTDDGWVWWLLGEVIPVEAIGGVISCCCCCPCAAARS